MFAPPCSGPLSAPIAPVMTEYRSESVAAMTRAANVLALNPCSACRIRIRSIAFVSSALGSRPFSMYMKLPECDRLAFGSSGSLPCRRR